MKDMWNMMEKCIDSGLYIHKEYEIEVRWFFQRVPREVRAMYPLIINAFKQKLHDTRTK
jgi:hypothetical protein